MDGYGWAPSFEARCSELEESLLAREGRRPLFPDAIAREPLEDLWGL
jgi:hypothetical protein